VQAILAWHLGYRAEQLIYRDRVVGFGVLHDSNDFAQFLVICMALLGVFWNKWVRLANIVIIPPAAILLYAIYLTSSRGAVIGLVAVFGVLVSTKIPKGVSAVLAVLLILVLTALGFGGGREYSMSEGSAAGRVKAWGSGIADLRLHPFFGVGYLLFTDYNDLTAHNSFVLCFSELGFFGYFFWLALIVVAVIGMERAAKTPIQNDEEANTAALVTALRAALYGFLVTAWFLSRTYNESLYVLLALCGSFAHMHQQALAKVRQGVMAAAATVENAKAVVVKQQRPALPTARWVRLTFALQVISVIVIYISVRLRTL